MSVRVPRPLLFLPLAILAGCASGGAQRPGKAATPEVNALYDRMNQASKGYESSIDQARRGDTPQAAQTRKRKAAAQKSSETRKRTAAKRSAAAKKGARTRAKSK